MNVFNCVNCRNLVQVESGLVGELVECPFCGHVQIVPDPMLSPGLNYCGYAIRSAVASGVMWNSYLADGVGETAARKVVFLRVPSTFLLKRIKDFKAFAGPLCNAGTSKVAAFPALLDRRLSGDGLYLVHEAVLGAKDLAALAAGAPLKPLDAMVLAKRTADALAAAWDKTQIAHLNLNPEKILVHISRLEVKIVDFGTAAAVVQEAQLLNTGLNIWDLRYAAPEFLAEGRGDSPLCDIYSLGCIMVFMLTGRHPVSDDAATAPSSPVTLPQAAAEKAGIPREVVTLVNAMTAPDPAMRPPSWAEVIGDLDAALVPLGQDRRAIEIRRKVNLWSPYRAPAAAPPVTRTGHRAGTAAKKIYLARPEDKNLVKAAHGRVFAVNMVKPVNRHWQPSPAASAASSGERGLMVAAVVIALVALTVLMVKNLSTPSAPSPTVAQPPEDLPDDAGDAGEMVPATRAPATGPPSAPPPTRRQAELLAQYEEIEEFIQENPEEFDGAIQRYEAVKRPFVLIDDQPTIGEINEKIFTLERLKQRKIETVMGDIADAVKPLLERRENDKAVNYLRTYDGPYAFETKRQRAEFERRIIAGLSFVELERGKAIIAIDTALETHVHRLMAGDTAEFVSELERQKAESTETMRPLLESLIAQCRFLAENRSRLLANPAAAPAVIKQLEALNLPDHAMAKGLLAATAGSYDEAHAHFDQMPFGLGYHFFRPCFEREAAAEFAKILKDNTIPNHRGNPETLVGALARRKINDAAARKLIAELQEYERSYADTEFHAANRRIIEILLKYSLDMHEDRGKAMEREIVISPDDGGSLGAQLARTLEHADNWTTIRLKPGVYRLGATDDAHRRRMDSDHHRLEQSTIGHHAFRLSLTGLKLIGEPGVIFENDLVITAQSVEISNIHVRRGKFNIMPHSIGILPDSGNIVVRNCIFENEETRLIRANDITLENCFMKGLFIERCQDVQLEHCTIISQERGLSQSAALWIDGGNVTIRDSIIYGEKYYALMFSDKRSGIKKPSEITTNRTISISRTIIFGEQGLCAFQFEDRPLDDQDVITNPARVTRYFRSRSNIFYPPQFTDPQHGDWRLVAGTPGYKGGAPKYRGGPIFYSRSRDARDCGVVWPEPEPGNGQR